METIAQLQYTFIILALAIHFLDNYCSPDHEPVWVAEVANIAFSVCVTAAAFFTLIRVWG